MIHLNELGCLPLLKIFETLHIPDAVWSEAVQKDRLNQDSVSKLRNVQRHTLPSEKVTKYIEKYKLEVLQAGERECLVLCLHLAVRDFAKRLKLTPVGSLGILIKAYQQGIISIGEAEGYILQLYDVSSLFVTRAIVELAIEQLRKAN